MIGGVLYIGKMGGDTAQSYLRQSGQFLSKRRQFIRRYSLPVGACFYFQMYRGCNFLFVRRGAPGAQVFKIVKRRFDIQAQRLFGIGPLNITHTEYALCPARFARLGGFSQGVDRNVFNLLFFQQRRYLLSLACRC